MVGVLFALAGVSDLVFLSLPLANQLLLEVGVFSGIAELSMMLWLLVKGIDTQRWIERATADGMVGASSASGQPARASSLRSAYLAEAGDRATLWRPRSSTTQVICSCRESEAGDPFGEERHE
jgi:hypothetical protein